MNRSVTARLLLGLALAGAVVTPASAVATATSSSSPSPSEQQEEQRLAAQVSSVPSPLTEEPAGDSSTNCYGSQVPFLSGVVKDPSGNAVAGAMVTAKILGLGFSPPVSLGPFEIYETKSDGSYSLCTWDSSETFKQMLSQRADSFGANAMIVTAVPPSSTSGTSVASRIDLLVYAPRQGLPPLKTPGTSDKNADCLDPTLNATNRCRINFTLGTPVVTASAKTSTGNAIPRALATLEYFHKPTNPNLNGFWTQLSQFSMNSTGQFGMSGFSSTNSFRLKVQSPSCDGEQGETCPFDNLGSQSDGFTVTVPTPPAATTAAWDSNSQSHRDFTLVPANFTGTVKDGLGGRLNDLTQMVVTKGQTTINESTTWTGRFGLTLTDGTWSVLLKAGAYDVGSDATYTVVVSGGTVTSVSRGATVVCSTDSTPCTTMLELPLAAPNFVGIVKDTSGATVEAAGVNFSRYDSTLVPGWPFRDSLYVEAGKPSENGRASGLIGFGLTAGRIYEVQMNPPWGGTSETVNTTLMVKAVADGSNIKLQRCAAWNRDPAVAPCQAGFTNPTLDDAANTLPTDSSGRTVLEMSLANFRGVACAPGDGCTTVGRGYVNVLRFQANQCQGCTGGFYQWANISAAVNESGIFALSIPSAGSYRLELDTPRMGYGEGETDTSLLYAKSTLDFVAQLQDGTMKFYVPNSSGNASSTELSTVPISNKGSRIASRYRSPSLIAFVKAPDGTRNAHGGASLFKEIQNQFREHVGHYPTNAQGVLAIAVNEGKYVLEVHPSGELQSKNLTPTDFRFSALDCDANGTVEIYTHSSVCGQNPTPIQKDPVENKYAITLQGANFVGVLRQPDGAQSLVGFSQLNVEKWAACDFCGPDISGQWMWANKWARTDAQGKFVLNFSEAGRFRVTFQAPSNLQSQYSSSRMVVDVTVGSSVVVTPVADSRVWSAGTDGAYNVKLSLPNASGTVTRPNGTAAANSWITVEKWSASACIDGCYQWSAEVGSTNSSPTGDYALTLPQGRWKLTYNPPQGVSGMARATREVFVESDGDLCLYANSAAGTACSTTVQPGGLDVAFPTPNFAGTVKAPGGSVSQWSSIQFQRLSGDLWQWVNMWSNTDVNGQFGMNFTENATYRVTFEPAMSLSGVSSRTVFVRSCNNGDVVELLASEAAARSGTSCSGSGRLDDASRVFELAGSNMRGTVVDGTATPPSALANASISVFECATGGDFCNWVRGVNTKTVGSGLGSFDINLTDGDSPGATRYRIEVNPPWNNSRGLVRVEYTVWVSDFDTGSPGVEWCLGGNGTTCADPQNSSDTWSISLTSGNLAGTILPPTGTTGVANANMNVERWTVSSWDAGQYRWEWSNVWANSNQSGAFGLNLTTPGLYRLTVNPSYDNSAGYARRRIHIRVREGGDWCVRTDTTFASDSATPDSSTCNYGRDSDPADGIAGLAARLSDSNFSGTLYGANTDLQNAPDLANVDKKVRGAWLSLQKKVNGGSWEWLGGSNSSAAQASRGRFTFNIDSDGDYRVDVQAPWNSSGDEAQFDVEFSATGCPNNCQFTMESSTSVATVSPGVYAFKYPSPNFKGTVFGKDGTTKIGGAWLNVQNSSTYQWVSGSPTVWTGSRQGQFAMRLDDGSYRVEVWPRWDDVTNGMRRTLTVSVSGGVVTCSAGCMAGPDGAGAFTVALRGENLSGTVKYLSNPLDQNSGLPMAWGWADVRRCGDTAGTLCDPEESGSAWVEGIGANQNGRLQLSLEGSNNPYLVTLYPNWGLYQGAPLRVLVKVNPADANDVSWKYESEPSYERTTVRPFEPTFGLIPPNVTVTVNGATGERFVDLWKCTSTCSTATDGGWMRLVTVKTADVSSVQVARFTVTEAGTYKVVALRTAADSTAGGTAANATAVFGYSSGNETLTVSVRP